MKQVKVLTAAEPRRKCLLSKTKNPGQMGLVLMVVMGSRPRAVYEFEQQHLLRTAFGTSA